MNRKPGGTVVGSAPTQVEYEDPQPPIEPMRWQASEFVQHQKSAAWYAAIAGVAVVLVIVAVIIHQWLSIAVFAAAAAALIVYSNKAPRTLSYELNENGLAVEGKRYSYNQFRSFSVISDTGWHTVELDPVQRFMPRLTVLFDSKDFDKIVSLLSLELPRVDRHPDLVERITKSLRF